jgi:transcriptional regulator with XRE-family HTH domain
MDSLTTAPEQSSEHGKLLKLARISAGLTQRELSIKTEINIRTIQEYEQDRCKPSATNLIKIMVACGIPADQLMPTAS